MDIQRKYGPYHWQPESMASGVELIDNFRKKYIELLNLASEAVYEKRCDENIALIFHKMAFFAENYFLDEEMMLQQYGYPLRKGHKQDHQNFVNKIFEIQKKVQAQKNVCLDVLDYLDSWFSQHLKTYDEQAIAFLRKKNVK